MKTLDEAKERYSHDTQYMDILMDIRDNGVDTAMRNMTCRKVHGRIARYDMKKGFPLLMHKKVYDSFSKEMTWMTRGETNTNTLGCKIWDKWADAFGELGPVYGEQMRNQVFYKIAAVKSQIAKFKKAGYVPFGKVQLTKDELVVEFGEEQALELIDSGKLRKIRPQRTHVPSAKNKSAKKKFVAKSDDSNDAQYIVTLMRKHVDQLSRAIKELEEVNETGIANRRILISLWNNADYEMQALPPCHTIFHFLQLPATQHERYLWVYNKLYEENYNDYRELAETTEDPALTMNELIERDIQSVIIDYEFFNNTETHEEQMQIVLDEVFKAPKFKLDLVLFMRSNDYPVGAPFNVGGYAQVLGKMAQEVNMISNELIHFASDVHIYEDQFDSVDTQIAQYRDLLEKSDWTYPKAEYSDTPITEMTHEDFTLHGYTHMPFIPTPVTE